MFRRNQRYQDADSMQSSSSLIQEAETTSLSTGANLEAAVSHVKHYTLCAVFLLAVLICVILFLAVGSNKAWLSNMMFDEKHEGAKAQAGVAQESQPKPGPSAATTRGKASHKQAGSSDLMPVACVTGENTKDAAVPPDGVCDFLVFAHVTLDESNNHFVASSSNEGAFQHFLKAASKSSATRFLLSVQQRDSEYFAEQMGNEGHAARLLGRYRSGRIRGYGFARYVVRDTDADRTQLKKLHTMLVKLRHILQGEELVVFMGIRFVVDPAKRQARLNELIQAVSSSLTFLALITHVTPGHAAPTEACVVDPIDSWTNSSFNNKSHLSMREAAELVRRQTGDAQRHQSFLLSSSMAVVYYDVDEDADRNAELRDVPCTGASVSSYATVCSAELGWKVGAEGIGDYVRYEQFAEMGKWRTYKTRPHLAIEMRAALDLQMGSRSQGLGWAFYDVDLDDGEGRCASRWKLHSAHEARFFRLKEAAKNFRDLGKDFRETVPRYFS